MLSKEAVRTLQYMKRKAPMRGGFMYEGARPSYENGAYKDRDIDELLSAGLIAPHSDPKKGWVVIEGESRAPAPTEQE